MVAITLMSIFEIDLYL